MTGIRHKEPAPAAVGPTSTEEEEGRDQTIETEWFPIFREGDYPQGEYKRKDIDEIVEEFGMVRRRSPIVFDHLNMEDLAEGAKPGAAVGYVIELRASNDETPEYKGKRLLEARAKVTWWGSYRTRTGEFRNCSVGLYHHTSHVDGKERLALHHLALLGAQTPGVEGLPETIFSAISSQSQVKNVSFSLGSEFRIERHSSGIPSDTNHRENAVEPIAFSEHQARLDLLRSELTGAHEKEVTGFRSQIETLNARITKFQEELDQAKAEVTEAKAATATAVEAAKQEGVTQGIAEGEARKERLFAEQTEKDKVVSFCEGLRTSGRINEKEFKGEGDKPSLADQILSIPAGPARESFKSLLSSRQPLTSFKQSGAPSSVALFQSRKPEVDSSAESDEAREAAATAEAQDLVREGKFPNFRAAFSHLINASRGA